MNPFDLNGPSFLVLFAVVAVIAFFAGHFLKQALRSPSAPLPEEPNLTPSEVGYLAGGPARAVHTALTHLVDSGQLAFDHAAQIFNRIREEGKTDLQKAILGTGPSFSVKDAFSSAAPALDRIRDRLEELGLLLEKGKALSIRLLPPLFLLATIVFGSIKIGVGVSRGKDVGFLVIGCIVLTVIALYGLFRRQVLTQRGAKFLADLREKHAALQTAASKAPSTLQGHDLRLAVGLFGVGVLAGGVYAGLHQAMMPLGGGAWHTAGTGWASCSSGWSSCGSGSCSSCSSGSGCGGGGCGGGGCGGCGGGD